MNKIYITNSLLEFKTKKIPKNSIIINIEKFNNNNFIQSIIKKLNINHIIVENSNLHKYISNLLPNFTIHLIDNEPKTHIYKHKNTSYFFYFLLLSSITTFVFLNMTTRKYSFIIAITLIINSIFWMISYKFLIKNQPWDNLIVNN